MSSNFNILYRILLIALATIVVCTFEANATSQKQINTCKTAATLRLDQMGSIHDFQEFIKNGNFQDLGELVCCLPKELRENYILGMNSAAGQNGTPDSPRAIMFSPPSATNGRDNKPPRFMLSFNGGKSHNSQKNSLEIAFFNEKTRELEFYDARIEKSGVVFSEKNPKLCLVCHGETGKTPAGGPKYIFDPFSYWPRFVGGTSNCNPEANKLQNILADHAVEVVKKESRYRCLDKTQVEARTDQSSPSQRYPNQAAHLGSFDNQNLIQDNIRAGIWLRSRPQFEKYKYLIFGSSYCGIKKIESWLPAEKVKELTAHLRLDPRLIESGDLKTNFNQALQQEWNKSLESRRFEKLKIESPKTALQDGYNPSYSSQACYLTPQIDESSFAGFKESDFKDRSVLLLLNMDKQLKRSPLGQTTPSEAIRLFLEGENQDHSGMISTTMTEFTDRQTRMHAQVLLGQESENSELKRLFKEASTQEYNNLELSVDFVSEPDGKMFKPLLGKQETCSHLQTLSKSQFQQLSPKPHSTTPQGVN